MSCAVKTYHLGFGVCLVLLTLHLPAAFGQISVGIKGSYYLSITQSEEIAYDDAYDFLSHKLRFIEEDLAPVPELFVQYENRLIYFKTGMAYRQINSRFRYRDFLDYGNSDYRTLIKETKTLAMPMEAGLVLSNMKFGAGPTFSWTLSENEAFGPIEELEERRRSFTSGFHVSFSTRINNLYLEILYEQRFHGIADYIYYRGDSKTFQQASRYISLGLAYVISFN